MLEHKSIASLTLNEARVLLAPDTAQALLGADLRVFQHAGETRVIDALASPQRLAAFWAEFLSDLKVALLDVNAASSTALGRIPGLPPAQVDVLVKARPYFSLADLSLEGADLAEVGLVAGCYLSHEGYEFLDKPRERMVTLTPHPSGVIVRHRGGISPAVLAAVLEEAKLLEMASDPAERLLVCHWNIPLEERAARLRALKQSAMVETVSPFLEDDRGQVRLLYPDRFDLALHAGMDTARWEQLLAAFELTLVQRFAPGYGSVRVKAHPHDLGALYRSLRAVAKDPGVRFVEPTYLVVDNP